MIEFPESLMSAVPLNTSLDPSAKSSDQTLVFGDTVSTTMYPEEYRKRRNRGIIDC
jgi:hypothetical protein